MNNNELISFSELQPLTLTLAIIGKMGSAAAFGLIYIYSLELYPTVVRNGGMELSSCVGRIGSMLAPYVAQSVRFFYQCLKKKGGVLIYLLFDLLVFIKYELLSVIRAFAFDICSINQLTLILIIIDLCDIKPIMMLSIVL
jgi:hypothetical protein